MGGDKGQRLPARRFHEALECLYTKYNRREYVHPDPLEFLYAFPDRGDREVVGLVAASLAVGRVTHILRSVGVVLERLGPHPARRVKEASAEDLGRLMIGFKHRFLTGENMAAMLAGAGRIIRRYGSLEGCFTAAMKALGGAEQETVLPALAAFAAELGQGGECGRMVSHPSGKSACKKLNLYLRWMVRSDDVDPGRWQGLHPRQLIVPLDVHMHRIAQVLGLTNRKQADLEAALQVTAAFRQVAPDDPVKYDFALTRLGIRTDTDRDGFLEQCLEACRNH
jgi:uncharacterized protein (TIGR02757 family)